MAEEKPVEAAADESTIETGEEPTPSTETPAEGAETDTTPETSDEAAAADTAEPSVDDSDPGLVSQS